MKIKTVKRLRLMYVGRVTNTLLTVCPFDCTALVASGKVGRPKTGLTTPTGKR